MSSHFSTISHHQVMSVINTQSLDSSVLCPSCTKKIEPNLGFVTQTINNKTLTYHKDCWVQKLISHYALSPEDHSASGCYMCAEYLTMNNDKKSGSTVLEGQEIEHGVDLSNSMKLESVRPQCTCNEFNPTQNNANLCSSCGGYKLPKLVEPQGKCDDCAFEQNLDIQIAMCCTKCGAVQFHTCELGCRNICINKTCPSNDLTTNRNYVNGKRSPLIMLPEEFENPVGYNPPRSKPKKCKSCKGAGCLSCSGRIVREVPEMEGLGQEDMWTGFIDSQVPMSFDSQHSFVITYKGYGTLIKEVCDDRVANSEEELIKIYRKNQEALDRGEFIPMKRRLIDIAFMKVLQKRVDRYNNLYYNQNHERVTINGRTFNINVVSSFDEERERKYKQEKSALRINEIRKHMRLMNRPPLSANTEKFLKIAIKQMIEHGIQISPEIPEGIDEKIAGNVTWNWFNDGKLDKNGNPRDAHKSIAVSIMARHQKRELGTIYVGKVFSIGTYESATSDNFYKFLRNDNSMQDEVDSMKRDLDEMHDFFEIELQERMKHPERLTLST